MRGQGAVRRKEGSVVFLRALSTQSFHTKLGLTGE